MKKVVAESKGVPSYYGGIDQAEVDDSLSKQ